MVKKKKTAKAKKKAATTKKASPKLKKAAPKKKKTVAKSKKKVATPKKVTKKATGKTTPSKAKKKAATTKKASPKLKKAVAKKKKTVAKSKKSVAATKKVTKRATGKTAPSKAKKKAAEPKKTPPKLKKAISKKKTVAKPKKPLTAARKAPALKREVAQPTRAVPKKRAERPPKVEVVNQALKQDITTVLVTGACGAVGRFLVRQLLKEGYAVVATDSRTDDLDDAKGSKALTLMPGSLETPGFIEACLEGVDAVFNAASHIDHSLASSELGVPSGKVLAGFHGEARKRGVKRFIHFSSGSLYKRLNQPLAEDGPLEARSEFDQQYLEWERVLLNDAGPGLPVVTILRSAASYGPGCRTQMASIAPLPALAMSLGPYYIKISDGPRMNLAHSEDVARAAAFLLLHPKASGEVFNIADNDPMPFGEFVNLAMEVYGLKTLGPGVPYPPSTLLESILPYVAKEEIFNPLSKLSSLLWDRMSRKHKLTKILSPRIDLNTISMGNRDLVLDNRKLLEAGFRLKYPKFLRGWVGTQDWYVENKWIPRPEKI